MHSCCGSQTVIGNFLVFWMFSCLWRCSYGRFDACVAVFMWKFSVFQCNVLCLLWKYVIVIVVWKWIFYTTDYNLIFLVSDRFWKNDVFIYEFFIINVISKGCVIFIWSITKIINIFDYEIELNKLSVIIIFYQIIRFKKKMIYIF